jgi:hypothetical protein
LLLSWSIHHDWVDGITQEMLMHERRKMASVKNMKRIKRQQLVSDGGTFD